MTRDFEVTDKDAATSGAVRTRAADADAESARRQNDADEAPLDVQRATVVRGRRAL